MRKKWQALLAWFVGPYLLLASMFFALACGPALLQQHELNGIGGRAVADCKAQGRQALCKADAASPACLNATKLCRAALSCVKAVAAANTSIQAAQVQRAGVGSTADEEALAKQSYDAAVNSCASNGWKLAK